MVAFRWGPVWDLPNPVVKKRSNTIDTLNTPIPHRPFVPFPRPSTLASAVVSCRWCTPFLSWARSATSWSMTTSVSPPCPPRPSCRSRHSYRPLAIGPRMPTFHFAAICPNRCGYQGWQPTLANTCPTTRQPPVTHSCLSWLTHAPPCHHFRSPRAPGQALNDPPPTPPSRRLQRRNMQGTSLVTCPQPPDQPGGTTTAMRRRRRHPSEPATSTNPPQPTRAQCAFGTRHPPPADAVIGSATSDLSTTAGQDRTGRHLASTPLPRAPSLHAD